MTLFQLPTVADDDDDDDEEEAEEDDDDDDEDARDDDDEEEEELDDDDEPADDISILNVPFADPTVHCPDMLQPPPPSCLRVPSYLTMCLPLYFLSNTTLLFR